MPVLQKFNQVFASTFNIIAKSIPDNGREEETLLHAYVRSLAEIREKDDATLELFDMFSSQITNEFEDIVYNMDANDKGEIFLENKLKFLADINFNILWQRFVPLERQVFIKNFANICRHYHIILTCGDSMMDIEMAATKNAPPKGQKVNPADVEDIQANILEDLLSSKSFIRNLTKKGAMSKMVKNVAGVVRASKGEDTNDLFDIVKMAEDYSNISAEPEAGDIENVMNTLGSGIRIDQLE